MHIARSKAAGAHFAGVAVVVHILLQGTGQQVKTTPSLMSQRACQALSTLQQPYGHVIMQSP